MIEASALVSGFLGRWDDFAVIFGLLVFNAVLEFWQDSKASSALAALKNSLAPEATALREGQWQTEQASTLVPGDIVKIRLGVIVPADLRLVRGDYAVADHGAEWQAKHRRLVGQPLGGSNAAAPAAGVDAPSA